MAATSSPRKEMYPTQPVVADPREGGWSNHGLGAHSDRINIQLIYNYLMMMMIEPEKWIIDDAS